MKHILYIQENKDHVSSRNLISADWQCTFIAEDQLSDSVDYHLIIWQTMQPHTEFINKLTACSNNGRIIVSTICMDAEVRISLLKMGVEDIMDARISDEEFRWRLHSLLLITPNEHPLEALKILGSFTFDYARRELKHGEENVHLTTKESELLNMLVKSVNQPVPKKQALETIWGEDSYHNGRSMDVYIGKLRKYLCSDTNIQIQNIHGLGYKLSILP